MRFFDILFSLLGVILLSPIIVIISVLIKTTSKGPIIFSHKRVGKNCKEFYCYKFRTMIDKADKMGSYMTKKNDPRITKLGQYLRKFSLDELPQLINVFLGHMSLVGPRPDTINQMRLYTEEERKERHAVRPGITGLAQVKARHTATNRERKKYDLFYVSKKSFCFDYYLVLQTFKHLIKDKSY
ncbi:MAG: sugar transferase [Balneola sp.]